MRIITLNVNGIRSAVNKGLMDWLSCQKADVICVQELKAQHADLGEDHLSVARDRRMMPGIFYPAQKKGYSGVGIYSAVAPSRVVRGIGVAEFDNEGRVLRADFDGAKKPLSVVSVYFPSGSASEDRQASKFRFLDAFFPVMRQWFSEHLQSGREFIVCGDCNIAHNEIDLKNWKGNLKNSGFLPEERAWLTKIFDELGWVDVFRLLDPRPDQYTWWSNRGQARAKNVGWRIDYQIATPGVAAMAKKVEIMTERRFSDHAPLVIDYAD